MSRPFIPTPQNPAETLEQISRLEAGKLYIDDQGYYWLKEVEACNGLVRWVTPSMDGAVWGNEGLVEAGGVVADRPIRIVDSVARASSLSRAIGLLDVLVRDGTCYCPGELEGEGLMEGENGYDDICNRCKARHFLAEHGVNDE